MQNKKQIPYTTLSYWPNKEFEIIGIVEINREISSAVISESADLSFFTSTNLEKNQNNKFEWQEGGEDLWKKVDAIIDLKPFNPQYSNGRGHTYDCQTRYIGTAIKFKK